MLSLNRSGPVILQKRFYGQANYLKVSHKWAFQSKAMLPWQLACEHFDFFYKPIFKERWPSIRLGLFSSPKYCAVVNSYGNVSGICDDLKAMGAVDLLEELLATKQRYNEGLGIDKQTLTYAAMPALNAGTSSVTDELSRRGTFSEEEDMLQELVTDAEADAGDADGDDDADDADSEEHHLARNNTSRLNDSGTSGDETYSRTDASSLMEFKRPEHKLTAEEIFSEHSFVFGNRDVKERQFFSLKFNEMTAQVEVVQIPDKPVYPRSLKVMVFPAGDISTFPQSSLDRAAVLGYYLMDGASVFAALALGVTYGDKVLDLCAAPGGKTFVILQSLLPGSITANDYFRSTLLRKMLESYLPENADIRDAIFLKFKDAAREWVEYDRFDKVIVDVPCNNDRYSLTEADPETSLFRRYFNKERLLLPELQAQMLVNGIRSCRPGGDIVYSTCTLTPLQNDRVVERALQMLMEDEQTRHMNVVVKDLTEMADDFKRTRLFRFYRDTQYGKLVLPYIVSNFGPMYVSKLQRLK